MSYVTEIAELLMVQRVLQVLVCDLGNESWKY